MFEKSASHGTDPSTKAGNRRTKKLTGVALAATLSLAACSGAAAKHAVGKETSTTSAAITPEKAKANLDATVVTRVAQLSKRVIAMYDAKNGAKKIDLADDQGYETINIKYDVPTNSLGYGFVGRYSFSLTARRGASGDLDPSSVKKLSFSKNFVDANDDNNSWPISSTAFTREHNSQDWSISWRAIAGNTVMLPVEFNTAYPDGNTSRYMSLNAADIDNLSYWFNNVINQAKTEKPMPSISGWEA